MTCSLSLGWESMGLTFFGGGKHHLLSAFIRFCGKTANLSDIAPHHRIDKHKSSHTGWALVLHFFFLYVRDYRSISSIWSRCMLHLLGTSLLFYLTQRSGHAPRLGLPNRYSIHAVKNLSSKKKMHIRFSSYALLLHLPVKKINNTNSKIYKHRSLNARWRHRNNNPKKKLHLKSQFIQKQTAAGHESVTHIYS